MEPSTVSLEPEQSDDFEASNEEIRYRETRARTIAQRAGMILRKPRSADIEGNRGYLLVDAQTNAIEWGGRQRLTLEEIEDVLANHA